VSPRRRRFLAGIGLLVPAVALLFVSAYILLGGAGTQQCTYTGGSLQHSTCTSDPTGAALATFPAGILCLVLSAAVFRGARWARWPAAVVGAPVGTITAAASVAVLVSLAGDGNVAGAVCFAIGGAIVSVACALPALMLSGDEGAEALQGRGAQPGRA
jgi:cytochrome bd-type quinol oxidase subunit 2